MIAIVESATPILLLPMVYDSPNNVTFVASTSTTSGVAQVHNTAFHVFVRLHIACDLPVVSLQLTNAVVPMDRAGESISDKETEETSLLALSQGNCCRRMFHTVWIKFKISRFY